MRLLVSGCKIVTGTLSYVSEGLNRHLNMSKLPLMSIKIAGGYQNIVKASNFGAHVDFDFFFSGKIAMNKTHTTDQRKKKLRSQKL
jgi:hypothetical protein